MSKRRINNSFDPVFFLVASFIFIVLYPFVWVYEHFGAFGLSVFLVSIGWVFWFYQKRKRKPIQNKKPVQNPSIVGTEPSSNTLLITPNGMNSAAERLAISQKDKMSDSDIFYHKFIDECWRTMNEPTPHPDVARSRGLYFMRHPLNDTHGECLRSLQIIRESIDIILASKKEDTIVSRMEVIGMHYNGHTMTRTQEYMCGLQDYQYLFKSDDYHRIHERFASLIKDIHTTAYVNVANGHLNKMSDVKMPKTKMKYLNLAIDALEKGMIDPEADHATLQTILERLRTMTF